MYIILLLTLFTFCDIKLCSRVSQMTSTNLCLTFGQLSLIFNILVTFLGVVSGRFCFFQPSYSNVLVDIWRNSWEVNFFPYWRRQPLQNLILFKR